VARAIKKRWTSRTTQLREHFGISYFGRHKYIAWSNTT